MRHPAFAIALLLSTPVWADQAPTAPGAPVSTIAPAPVDPAPPPAPTPVPPAVLALPDPPPPNAGYQGSFFLRDSNDWFVMLPKGRLHVDGYFFPARGDVAPGVVSNSSDDKRPRDIIFIRRARAEVQGTIGKHIDFQIGGEFATTTSGGQYGMLADAFVAINYTPYAVLQVGNFNMPFMQENRTSNKTLDFMERSVAVRGFGVPANKDAGAMLFGQLPSKVLYYSLGAFNGEGQNFRNLDNFFAVLGRAFVAPLAPWAKGRRWMEELTFGASGWWQHVENVGTAAGVGTSTSGGTPGDVANLTTQGGWSFFSSNYKNGSVYSHLVPSGTIAKWAVEAHLPFHKFGIKWELVHQSMETGRYDDANGAARVKAGPGTFGGYATYVELYGWLIGDRTILEAPGLNGFPRLDFKKKIEEPRWGLMAVVKYEHLSVDVTGPPVLDAMGGMTVDPSQGNYKLDVIEVGLNAWLTKHIRLTANYVANHIDGDSAQVRKNLYYQQFEHELLFRAGISL